MTCSDGGVSDSPTECRRPFPSERFGLRSEWSRGGQPLDKTPLVPARRGGVRAHIPRSHCVNAWQRVRSGVRVPNLRQSVRPAPNNPLVIRSKINRKTSPNFMPLSDDRDVARGEVSVRRAAEQARVPVPLAIVRHAGQNPCRQRVDPRCRRGRPPPGAENGRYGQPAGGS